MNKKTKEHIRSSIILLTTPLLIMLMTYPTSVVAHETTHVITYRLENIQVIDYQILTPSVLSQGYTGHILTIGESKHGRQYQENIAYTIQYITWALLIIFFFFLTDIKQQLITITKRGYNKTHQGIPV